MNGIFAFAIWDSLDQKLVLARDMMGVKPLYFRQTDSEFSFSSELKSLFALADRPRNLELESIQRYLRFMWCPGEGTPIEDVKKLGPGEYLVVKGGRINERGTWVKTAYEIPREPSFEGRNKITEITDRLRTAVHRQMLSDVPVGAFLSGGLDSSSIVAFARELNPDIRCFTIETRGGVDAGFSEDLPYAFKVAKHLNVDLDVIEIEADRMAQDLEFMLRCLDEPLADPAALNVFYISKLAREQDVKVLLSGTGGDDLFTGYRRHTAAKIDGYLGSIPFIRGRLGKSLASKLDQRTVLGRRLLRFLSSGDVKTADGLIGYFAWSGTRETADLYTKNFADAVSASDFAKPLKSHLERLDESVTELEKMLSIEQRFFLADHNLMYTDKMSMAAGVETRVPFLDPDVIHLARQLHEGDKCRRFRTKWLLKKAMEPFLPKGVIYRKKTGFGAPVRRWMRHDLRQLLGDTLSEEALRRRDLFDYKAVHRLMRANDAGETDASYTLFSLLCIEIWCQIYIDSK